MKKLRITKVCSSLGHTYPVTGLDKNGKPIHSVICSRCNHPNKSRIIRQQRAKDK